MSYTAIDLGRQRLAAADNGALDGQGMRLLLAARLFHSSADALRFVGAMDDEAWGRWVARLARDYAAEEGRP